MLVVVVEMRIPRVPPACRQFSAPGFQCARVPPIQLQDVFLDVEAEVVSTGTAPAHSSAEAAAALGLPDASRVIKSLVFVSALGNPLLVLARGSDRISRSALEEAAGCRVRLASAAEALELTGHELGSIPPISPTLCETLSILMDENVLNQSEPVYVSLDPIPAVRGAATARAYPHAALTPCCRLPLA